MSEICRTCGHEVKMQIQKNTGYCSVKCQEAEGDAKTAAEHLRIYRDIQRSEGLTIEAEKDIARTQGRAWRRYLRACKREGIRPESMDSPDLGRW